MRVSQIREENSLARGATSGRVKSDFAAREKRKECSVREQRK